MWIAGSVLMGHVALYNSSNLALTNKEFAWDRIPVFYNYFKIHKTFTWLYVKWKWVPNFWSMISNRFGSKGYLIYNMNFLVNLHWFRTALLVFLSSKISFIKARFTLCSVLKISLQRLLNLVTFIVLFPGSFRIYSNEKS